MVRVVRPADTVLFVCMTMHVPYDVGLYEVGDVIWREDVELIYPPLIKGDIMDRPHSPKEDSSLVSFVDGRVDTIFYDMTSPQTFYLPPGVKWRHVDWP